MSSSIRIPNPVVVIKRNTLIRMDRPITGTVIISVFRKIYHALVSPIKRSIKYGFGTFVRPFHFDFTQCFIPDVASGLGYLIDLVSIDFTPEIPFCLIAINKRDSITKPHTIFFELKRHRRTFLQFTNTYGNPVCFEV